MTDLVRDVWERDDSGRAGRLLVVAAAISTVAALLAILLLVAVPDLFARSDSSVGLEVWSGCVALVLVALGFREFAAKRLGAASATTLTGSLALIGITRQLARITWDYECFYQAGKLLGSGAGLYRWSATGLSPGGTRYWYSPLVAFVFSLLQRIPDQRVPTPVFIVWTGIGYWAACGFIPLLMATLRTVYGWNRLASVAAALALGVASTPVLRTLQYSQPNLIVADCLLGWLLLSRRREGLSAGLLGLGTLLKTSPIVMLFLLAWSRRWRALTWTCAWGVSIIVSSAAVIGWRPWREFLGVIAKVRSDGSFRDNSCEALLRAGAHVAGLDGNGFAQVAGWVLALVMLGTVVAAGVRCRGNWPWSSGMAATVGRTERDFPIALLAMILLSPVVWEHHWVWVALPCALVVGGRVSVASRTLALLGTTLIFFVPTFDFFPLSYHRLFGLLLVIIALQRAAPVTSSVTGRKPSSSE